jgi:hypothetical protein
MRNGDDINAVGITERTHAVPFSPYNLTARTLNAPVRQQDDTSSGDPAAIFTDYPSQIGALWQWAAATNPRYAWDAFNLTVPDFVVMDDAHKSGTYWNTLRDEHETCPPNYRRPTHGRIDGTTGTTLSTENAQLSELLQSLFEVPDLGYSGFSNAMANYRRGYYADGFFDRREIHPIASEPSVTATAESVSIDNEFIAGRGGVFFNIETYASLFFAEVGYRDGEQTGGLLSDSGDEHYWTASIQGDGQGWAFRGYPRTASALAIRCIYDSEDASVTVHDPWEKNPGLGVGK